MAYMNTAELRVLVFATFDREGLTLAEAAARVGVDRTHLWRVQAGKRPLNWKLATKIARAFPDLKGAVIATFASDVMSAGPIEA